MGSYRSMSFFLAREAEGGSTVASHVKWLCLEINKGFHSKLAVGSWAPLYHAVVLHKRAQSVALVPLLVLWAGHFLNHRRWNLFAGASRFKR